MENSLYVGLSRQVALKAQMDVVSNNIANMNTPGYRSQNMVFMEYVRKEAARGTDEKDPLSLVEQYGQYQSTAPGSLSKTGNPLDVAIQGDGYFGVQTAEGVMYTRAGNFEMNRNGDLITASGNLVAGEGGGAITIPAGTDEVKIAEDGTVSANGSPVGKIMVVEFANEQDLEAVGNNLYKTTAATGPAAESRVIQGALENSNVQPVLEMTRMIDILRNYQSIHRMLQTEHDRERNMIQKLSQA